MHGLRPDIKDERVWDPLVRLFHWSLVAAFATAWYARGEAWLHEGAGKVVLSLVIFRLCWGIIGPGSARFESFLRGPVATLRYVWDILRGRPSSYAGHNPAGAAMIILLLSTLAVITGSGILMSTTKLWGNGTVEFIHGQSANLLLWLIGAHVLGVLVASFQHKENLIFSMITGWKSVPLSTQPYLGHVMWSFRRLLFALVVAGFSVGAWQLSVLILNASAWRAEKIILAAGHEAGCATLKVSGPSVIVYPAVELHYHVSATGKALDLVVPLDIALAKKAAFNLAPLTAFCAVAPHQQLPAPALPSKQTEVPPLQRFGLLVPAKPFRQAAALPALWSKTQFLAVASRVASKTQPPKAVTPPLDSMGRVTGREVRSLAAPRTVKLAPTFKVRKLRTLTKAVKLKRRRVPRQRQWSGGGHTAGHGDDGDHGGGRGRGRGRSGGGGDD